MSQPKPPPFRRTVFYIPGFDPMSPRRYRELYRSQGARQARISGYGLTVAGLTGFEDYRWSVRFEDQDTRAETVIRFCAWNDLVRAAMARSILGTYAMMARTAWLYLRSGAFWALVHLRPAPMLAAVYPVVMLLAQALLALTLGALVAAGLPTLWLGLPLGASVAWAVLVAFKRADGALFAHYLMTDYAYGAQDGGATPPALAEREAAFARAIRAALAEDVDEVLVVGHSSGAHVGVGALARVLGQGPVPARPALSFLTLGQVIPMVSFLPQAQGLRRDLRTLASARALTWVDVTAPGDGACFALSDPVHVSGVAPPEADKVNPKVLSAAFSHTLSGATRTRTRWQFLRRHIQYLCAFERPGWYDYFQVSAGPMTLAARYGGRGATASRIETPRSPHRDV